MNETLVFPRIDRLLNLGSCIVKNLLLHAQISLNLLPLAIWSRGKKPGLRHCIDLIADG